MLLAVATVLVLALALGLLLGRPGTRSRAGTGATTAAADAPAPASAGAGFDGALLPGGLRAPGFTLTDQRGRRVSLAQYRGRVAILTFLSPACRPSCPLIAQQIRGALDELGADPVPVLIVGADPAAGTSAAVRRFLAEAALTGRVEYLSGTLAELRAVWRAYGVIPAELGDAGSPHPASVLLIDRGGFERDLFEVEQLTPEGLAHDVRRVEGAG
jgi:protein SCO1/2